MKKNMSLGYWKSSSSSVLWLYLEFILFVLSHNRIIQHSCLFLFSIFSLYLFIILAVQGGSILSVQEGGLTLSLCQCVALALAMQFAFSGERTQDVGAFSASFEHHALSIGHITDNEKLPLLVATFYSRARDWYDILPPNQQGAYQLLAHQFHAKYIQWRSATEVREELFRLKMESPFGFIEYELKFKDL